MPRDRTPLRKIYFVTGLVVAVLAAIVFWTNMARRAMTGQERNGYIDLFATLGAVLVFVIGAGIMRLSRRLAAVTELLLNLRAADDIHNPYASLAAKDEKRQYMAPEVPQIRCPRCLTLNEEPAKQCARCGKALYEEEEKTLWSRLNERA